MMNKLKLYFGVAQAVVMLWVIPYIYHMVGTFTNVWWGFPFVMSTVIVGVMSYVLAFYSVIRYFETRK